MREQINFVFVRSLKDFVSKEASRIESRRYTLRSIRQLTDARRFLDMLEEPKYSSILKVSDLKKQIANERKKLQEISSFLAKFLPGKQGQLAEENVTVTADQLNYLKTQKFIVDEEIHWLHKCLGICHNKEYFR